MISGSHYRKKPHSCDYNSEFANIEKQHLKFGTDLIAKPLEILALMNIRNDEHEILRAIHRSDHLNM